MSISNKFPGNVGTVGLGTTLCELLVWEIQYDIVASRAHHEFWDLKI